MPDTMDHAGRGRLGARVRWGAPRSVRLDGLSDVEREQIHSLIEGERSRRLFADADKAVAEGLEAAAFMRGVAATLRGER